MIGRLINVDWLWNDFNIEDELLNQSCTCFRAVKYLGWLHLIFFFRQPILGLLSIDMYFHN